MEKTLSERAQRVHAFLFVEGGALSWKRLAHCIGAGEDEAKEAAHELAQALEGSGLSISESEREVVLTTAPAVSDEIKAVFQAQLQRDIGEAGLEVLATLCYRGPSTRAEIDYIRGVNTSSTIRALLSRGLIERAPSSTDGREFIYRPSVELFAYLGVGKGEELPEYATISSELAAFEDSRTPFQSHAGEDRDDQPEYRAT